MAVQQTAGRVTIKGKYQDGADIKNVTITTVSGLYIGDSGTGNFKAELNNLADAVQDCVSATVTGFTFTYEGTNDGGYGEPGNKLESTEIFSEDFSDTQVVPTLQVVNMEDGTGKTKTFSFKYMADPIDTPDFDTKVANLSNELTNFIFTDVTSYNEFVRGDISFTAKDTITQAD